MAVGEVVVDEEGNATGDGLSFRIFEEILAEIDEDAIKAVAARVGPFCEGLARALDLKDARVVEVGKADWQYQTIAEGVAAAAALSPSAGARVAVRITPGYYDMDETIEVPSYVGIIGESKELVQLHNATTDMFKALGPSVFFRDFLIEGAAAPSVYAFDCNNQIRMHVRDVDMLMNGGTSTQKFLKQVGSTWTNLFIEHCNIDSYTTSGYLVLLQNSSTVARMVDVVCNDIFFDAYHLTDYGGSILIRDCTDVRVRNSTIRGAATYNTGIRLERQSGSTGTPELHVRHSFLEGGVPIYGTANTNYNLRNTDAAGSLTDGTRSCRNSYPAS
jgi:hypothetical protein